MGTAKTRDEQIEELLTDNRIPRYCWGSTLEGYGYPDLRSYVLSRRFLTEAKPVYLYPNVPSASERATFVAMLLAKELTLTGFRIHILSIMDLVKLYENRLSEERQEAIGDADGMMVRDFFVNWDNAPKNPLGDDLFKAEYVLKSLIEEECPVFFHAEHPPATAGRWWTQSMIQKILNSCDVYPVDL